MKRAYLILAVGVVIGLIYTSAGMRPQPAQQNEYEFPADVQSVIDKSCYGCHSINGKSDDAKNALRWDNMHEYDKKKMLSVMDEIIEVIEKQEMPPKKFLANKPEAKPSEQEYAILKAWAEAEADKLLK